MNRSTRLLAPAVAALAVAVPAAGLAVRAQADASSSTDAIALPDSTELTDGLETLFSPSGAASIVRYIQGIAQSPSTANVSLLDQALNAVLGSTAVTVPAKTAAAAPSIETSLASLSALTPTDPTAAQLQSISELRSALTSAGLSALISGLSSSSTTAISQLAQLQSLSPGASIAAGGLSSVAPLVSTLAGEAPSASGDATTLSAVAATLSSSAALTPAQLESAITGLASVTSSAPSGTDGVTVAEAASALADQLSDSGSLFGALANAGSPLSAVSDPTDVATASSQLTGLAGLAPGSTLQLSGLRAVLTAVAATPGVNATSADALESLASNLGAGSTAPAQALNELSGLAEYENIPAQLSSLLVGLTTEIEGSSAVLGTISGVSVSQQTEAMDDLSTLAGLGKGASTPTLPGLAAVLGRVESLIPSADATTAQAVGDLVKIMGSDPLTADELAGAAEVVADTAPTTSANVDSTLTSLAGVLDQDAENMGATATASTTPLTPAEAAHPAAQTTKTKSAPASASQNATTMQLTQVRRNGNVLAVKLACPDGGANTCAAIVRAVSPGARTVVEKVTVAAGWKHVLILKLSPETAAGATARHRAITLVISSNGHHETKTLK